MASFNMLDVVRNKFSEVKATVKCPEGFKVTVAGIPSVLSGEGWQNHIAGQLELKAKGKIASGSDVEDTIPISGIVDGRTAADMTAEYYGWDRSQLKTAVEIRNEQIRKETEALQAKLDKENGEMDRKNKPGKGK